MNPPAVPTLRRRALLAGLAAALPATAFADTLPFAPLPETGMPQAEPPLAAAPAQPLSDLPAWRRHAVAVDPTDARPKIAIVIDDLGVMREHTARAIQLPGPLTLAWFPFAPDLATQAAEGRDRGHETLLHMPMQAYSNSTYETGPNPLRVDLPEAVNVDLLQKAIAAVPFSVGLNNHMGSIATRSAALMTIVAQQTKHASMLFLDSVVIPHSEGVICAEAAGVPTAARDVFIDNTSLPTDISQQLALTEFTARHQGYAIAIGHPRSNTLAALESWLPTLTAKGFVLWPISATVALRNHLPITVA
jgi:polysaccharide deacetylase 2 family uncharacterized protein YibQ